MPQLHLPRASYDLFIYDLRYNFSGTSEYNSMQTVRTFTLARERINKMYGFVVIRLDSKQYVFFVRGCDYRKKVSMIRKYHSHKLQTNSLHREKESHNNHETPARQTKQSNHFSLPHQDDCKLEWT